MGARAGQSTGRDTAKNPRNLWRAWTLQPGMVVADVGTGVGYMLPYLSKAVGAPGRVLAEDIFDDFLKQAGEKTRAAGLTNVTFVKGSERNPALPTSGVDVALALDSYHHYNYPHEMLAGIHHALRRNGRFVVVEYYKRRDAIGTGDYALEHVRLDKPGVVKEIEAAGFRLLSDFEQIPGKQYGLVFRKN